MADSTLKAIAVADGGQAAFPGEDPKLASLLGEQVQRLADLNGATEEAFLLLGKHLADFHRRSRQVATQAERGAGGLLGEAAGAAIDDLQRLVGRLQQYHAALERNFALEEQALKEIRTLLAGLQTPLEAFRKIVKTLHSLGIATRIETAGSRREEAGGGAFADELKELATLIGARSGRILERLEALDGDCGKACEKLVQMQSGQSGASERLLRRAEAVLARMAERGRESSREVVRLSAEAAGFAQDIGEMVASIQFQDIVRQKLGHVELALAELAAGHRRGAVAEVCRLQTAHLQLAREEMGEAGGRIVGSLHALAARTSGLAAGTARAAGFGNAGGVSVFREMEEVIAAITLLLQSGVVTREESAQAIGAVAGAVDNLAVLLEEIDFLSEKMKVVALNAAIRAVHAGQEGAALGVIAESIQQLSGEALAQTRDLSVGFRQIMVFAASLGEAEGEGEKPESLAADAGVLLDRLQGIDSDLLAQLREMDAAATALAGDLRRTAGSLVVHEHFVREAGVVQEVLSTLAAQAQKNETGASAGKESAFQDLFSRYTMHSEREIHLAQRSGAGSGNIIDLQERRAARRGSEFGENVELF